MHRAANIRWTPYLISMLQIIISYIQIWVLWLLTLEWIYYLFKSPLVAYILTSINNLHGLKQLEIYLSIKYNMMYIHDVFTIYVFYIYLVNKLKMIITNIYLYQITCNLCLEFINQNYSTSLLHWIIVWFSRRRKKLYQITYACFVKFDV